MNGKMNPSGSLNRNKLNLIVLVTVRGGKRAEGEKGKNHPTKKRRRGQCQKGDIIITL